MCSKEVEKVIQMQNQTISFSGKLQIRKLWWVGKKNLESQVEKSLESFGEVELVWFQKVRESSSG